MCDHGERIQGGRTEFHTRHRLEAAKEDVESGGELENLRSSTNPQNLRQFLTSTGSGNVGSVIQSLQHLEG